jgi:AMP-binding enzyme C-terminal domain
VHPCPDGDRGNAQLGRDLARRAVPQDGLDDCAAPLGSDARQCVAKLVPQDHEVLLAHAGIREIGVLRGRHDRWPSGPSPRQGYVNITGRLKDMLNRGGENISPREIEEFLHTHPDVMDAQVIGVADARLGEEIMAWVQLRPGAAPLTVEDVRAFAAGKLSHQKIPRYVRCVTSFPMTVSGKVRKVDMRHISSELLGLKEATKA